MGDDKKIYLLLKTHNDTKLKYLCKHYGTEESCFTYTGSGTYWKNHIKKHGNNVETIIVDVFDDIESFKKVSIALSEELDIVNSKEYANLVIEDGHGGAESMHTPDARKKAVATMKKRWEVSGRSEKERVRDKRHGVMQRGKTMKERLNDPNWISPNKGMTMKERLNDPNWVNPQKGKSGKPAWNKGKKFKHLPDYKCPNAKPFYIESATYGKEYFKHEWEFLEGECFSAPTLSKLKKDGSHTIKRQRNSKHKYPHGETLYFTYA